MLRPTNITTDVDEFLEWARTIAIIALGVALGLALVAGVFSFLLAF